MIPSLQNKLCHETEISRGNSTLGNSTVDPTLEQVDGDIQSQVESTEQQKVNPTIEEERIPTEPPAGPSSNDACQVDVAPGESEEAFDDNLDFSTPDAIDVPISEDGEPTEPSAEFSKKNRSLDVCNTGVCNTGDLNEYGRQCNDGVKPLKPEAIAQHLVASGLKVFRQQYGDVYMWALVRDEHPHYECMKLKSKASQACLRNLIEAYTGLPADKTLIRKVIENLELHAYNTPAVSLTSRFCAKDDGLHIDLCDPGWHMISLTRDGWHIEPQSEPLFYRNPHQQPLAEPVHGGDLNELLEHFEVNSDSEKILIVSFLCAALYPQIPVPILLITGPPGSGKTTLCRQLRKLIDPSLTPVLGEIEMRDLVLIFRDHPVPCFENVSAFTHREADMFCRAVTGDGIQRRKLFTDDDTMSYQFRRPIIINGIDTPSMRPDFLDRCILINCSRMKAFRDSETLAQQFEAARPKLLGVLLDLVVKALALYEKDSLVEFRMADFAHFGRAIARAMGKPPEDFDAAYRLNIQQRNAEILDDLPMMRLLRKFVDGYSELAPWEGIAEKLRQNLLVLADQLSDREAKKDIPGRSNLFSKRLFEVAPALSMSGIIVKRGKRNGARRLLCLFRAVSEAVQEASDAVREAIEGGDSHE